MQPEVCGIPASTTPLRRQQLVWLDEYGWYRVMAGRAGAPGWHAQAFECLEYWVEHDLPLVVTRQHAGRIGADGEEVLALGLPAPARWARRRLSIESSRSAVRRVGAFPLAASLLPALPPGVQGAWAELCEGLDRLQLTARIYGSHGWQLLTGLDHLHPDSDIDLQLMVATSQQADAAVGLLAASGIIRPRLDGELCLADGASVAWREWAQASAGRVREVVVKRLEGATLQELAELHLA